MLLSILLYKTDCVVSFKDGLISFPKYENAKAGEVVNKKELTKQSSVLHFFSCIVYGYCAYIIRDILGHAGIEAKKLNRCLCVCSY